MQITGLTGGIATGKSTVSATFAQAGAIIVDADKIAHRVVQKGNKAWEQIVAHFGLDVLLASGEINRARLGDIIFNDPEQKKVLNNITHPEVFVEMTRQIETAQRDKPGEVIILDVPLLIESGLQNGMSDVVLVYTPEQIQLERLMLRDNISEADARARIQSQMPIEQKRGLASIVIDNSSSREETRSRALEVYALLKSKCANAA